MTAMNENMETISTNLDSMSANVGTNAMISQTLSLVGKDVTVLTENGEVIGNVEEAKFDGGVGYVKIGNQYYSIANITSIREPKLDADASATI
jgi:flagellar hook assembly protein FlgD